MKVTLVLEVDDSDLYHKEMDIPEVMLQKGAFITLPLETDDDGLNRCKVIELHWDDGDIFVRLELETNGSKCYDKEDLADIRKNLEEQWQGF